MVVAPYTAAHRQDWDEFVAVSATGSFFHTINWKTVLEKVFGYTSMYFLVEEQGVIQGVLPLFLVKNPLGRKTLISLPFAVYGGLCAESPSASQQLKEKGKSLACELGVDFLEFRHVVANGDELPIKELYFTFIREIFDGEEKNMNAIPRKQRRMIRQGIKHGLESKIGGKEFLREFYTIYTTSLRNLGTPAFPYRFFEILLDVLGEQCRILSVWRHNQMAAAVMTFCYKDQLLPYYGGGLPQFLPYAVYDFMYWELMRYGWEHGYKVFDFGRSKQGTGAYDFKRHWGFEPTPLRYQYYLPHGGDIPNFSPANPKFQPFISIWKRLPLSVANLIGPHVIKYLP
ncbi:MAG: FemAB family PEP-CTERM system-associated protein [Nitrospirales bacterium]|nr:FemAB family PEP-CTERM system-associated protein [Nitrospira sp.]MDR4501901.1 FemAB family PEP-CTERM system-associated protein [Nitrospirales bacterium]